MVRIKQGGSQIGFSPVNANTVNPTIVTDSRGTQTVHYDNLWSGVDVEYMVESNQVKEAIVLKDKGAASQIQFKMIGADLQQPKTNPSDKTVYPAFNITGALNNQFSIASASLFLNNFGPVANAASGLTQNYTNGNLAIGVNSSYVQNLPAKAFPAVIDPTVYFGTRGSGSFESFETNGYNCPASICDLYAGSLYDVNNNRQYWRGALHVDYSVFQNPGTTLNDASLYLYQRNGVSWWTGYTGTFSYQVGQATCLNGYNCMDGTWDSGNVGATGTIDVKNLFQYWINNGNWGGYLMVDGSDGAALNWKAFDPDNSYVNFTYNNPLPAPTFSVPQNNQAYVDPQASFQLNTESNPNNGTPLEYAFRITDGSGGNGTVINSGSFQNSNEWTAPDGTLQDGSTYYVEGASYDPSTGIISPWSAPVSFRINSRSGQDKTQTQSAFGPASVDLATGNLSTGISSHTTQALGGALGVQLNYSSPLKSRAGLVGSYWNTSGSGSASSPDLQRIDQNINFNWNSGSPGPGIGSTDFDAEWDGYFVAPTTGSYTFGGENDDSLSVTVNGQGLYSSSGCSSGPCMGSSISLTAGQVVPFQASYSQGPGSDYAQVYVSGAVPQQVVPSSWFQTGVRPLDQDQGLTGKYYSYTDNGNPPTFPSNGTDGLFMTRTDPVINFNWNSSSPIPNGPSSNFMVRWTGFLTVPTTGSYTFGTQSDDGSDITVNNQSVYSKWQDSPDTTGFGSAITLTGGQSYPIVIEYYQHLGGDAMSFLMQQSDGSSAVVPSNWLTPQAKTLPNGWDMGSNLGGSVTYNRLTVNQGNALLSDSSGDTYDYVWNGSGYTPPANSYGNLTRNDDGTYTLQDSDGKTYTFDTSGTLTSVTSAADDEHPAALRYTYAPLNGTGPIALQQITDGVNSNRYMKVYYSGASQCGSAPAGFYVAPTNMLCAVQTNDGRTTYFYYDQYGNLAEVDTPGNENATYQYQSVSNASGSVIGYQLTGIRGSLANDAVVAGVSPNDETTYTQFAYDVLGRVDGVTNPQVNTTSGPQSQQYAINYLIGATEEHIVGATEPAGYTERVEYDNLYRTTKVYNNQGLATINVWDPVKDMLYSTTNPEGLMTTTVYDDEDRPVSQYGPAPAVDFNTWNWSLGNGASLSEGQSLYSPDHRFQFTFQTDGNVVLYGPNGAMWASNTGGQTATSLVMQPDGNLVEYNGSTAIWATGTWGDGSTTYLAVQNDGNAILYDAAGPIWEAGPGGWTPSPTQSGYGTPLSSDASQVARTDVTYDQGMTGLGVAYMPVDELGSNNASLVNAPLLHSLNIANDGTITHDWGSTAPVATANNDWGISMTGGMRLPSTGSWNFNLTTDEGVRMWIDNQLVLDDWKDNTYWTGDSSKSATNTYSFAYNNTIANSYHSVRIDYYHLSVSNNASFGLAMTPPGGSQTSQVAMYFSPNYGLPTSTTSYDATYGNSTVSVNYGSNPGLGQVASTTVDPGGLNLTSSNAYEAQGSGYLRQTGQTSAGGNTTSYSYYGANDTAANPCVQGSPAAYQAGLLKSVTNPSPDGGTTPGIKATTIYDDAGNIVATQTNADGWDCKSYDARGRLTKEVIPAYNSQPSRTVTYNYDVGGNPFVAGVTDSSGTTTTTIDMLGRTVSYVDTNNDTTTTAYDTIGRVASVTGPQGTLNYTYDSYNRLTDEKLGATDMAQVSYDQYGRLSSVSYPNAGSLKETVGYDATTGAENALTYNTADPATYTDNATYSQSGKVSQESYSGWGTTVNSSYTYDTAGRLTNANIGGDTYAYGYGANNSDCPSGTAPNAGLDGNRTSVTYADGNSDYYCYNYADQLIGSPTYYDYDNAKYDSHGNMTKVGDDAPLSLTYDSSDRINQLNQTNDNGTLTAEYYKWDAVGQLTYRELDQTPSGKPMKANISYYGFSSNGTSPTVELSSTGTVIEKYLQLPGGVAVTIYPQKTTKANQYNYNLPNLHGDVLAMANGNGIDKSYNDGPNGAYFYLYDPFGDPIYDDTDNQDVGSWGYEGSHHIVTEDAYYQWLSVMGARVYFNDIGLFSSRDSVPGGNATAYAYPLDPINFSDITGLCSSGVVACFSGGEVGAMQSSNGAGSYLQPTVSTSRIQAAATAAVYERSTWVNIRAQAPVHQEDTLRYAPGVVSISTARRVVNAGLDIAALPPYAAYYAARAGHHMLDGNVITKYSLLNAALLGTEAIGLAEDAGIDLLKGESIDDEGQRGCVDPLHSYGAPCGPDVYLPGIDKGSGNIEW